MSKEDKIIYFDKLIILNEQRIFKVILHTTRRE